MLYFTIFITIIALLGLKLNKAYSRELLLKLPALLQRDFLCSNSSGSIPLPVEVAQLVFDLMVKLAGYFASHSVSFLSMFIIEQSFIGFFGLIISIYRSRFVIWCLNSGYSQG
jgi:hypothetical protein